MLASFWQGTVFDYYVDEASCSMVHWETRVPAFTYQPENFGSMFVPTVDTMRLSFLLELLMARNHFVMLVGNTGPAAALPASLTLLVRQLPSSFLDLVALAL